MVQSVSTLYGKTGAPNGASRFELAGDPRRMYPIAAAGGAFSVEKVPQTILSGGMIGYQSLSDSLASISELAPTGMTNVISNGNALFTIGDFQATGSVMAERLGVTGTTGGNTALNEYYGAPAIWAIEGTVPRNAFFYNGDYISTNTNATAGTLGAASLQFSVNVGGSVNFSASGTVLTGGGVAPTFTTAAFTGNAAYTGAPVPYLGGIPSDNLLRIGDIIRVENTPTNTLWSYHRITNINSATSLNVTPGFPFSGTNANYQLFKSGFGSYSRMVSLPVSTGYNVYFCGGGAGNPTIRCAQHVFGGGALSLYTAPQTTSGGANVADVKAKDIILYKTFLLYGNGTSISWSISGMQNGSSPGVSPFGGLDFPSGNVAVVDLGDNFISFEYLGDQAFALFERSIWQIAATGSVPEFDFFKTTAPVGVSMVPYINSDINNNFSGLQFYNRPSCSAGTAIYYWSWQGLMEFNGSSATCVSGDVAADILKEFNENTPNVSWEQSSDSILVTTNAESIFSSRNGGYGYCYNRPTKTWSRMDLNVASGPAVTPTCFTSGTYVQLPEAGWSAMFYDATAEQITFHDNSPGSPFTFPGGANSTSLIPSTWNTPVILFGDGYRDFPMAGFQLDASIPISTVTWQQYSGKTPYQLVAGPSGTITSIDDRRLMGAKLDAPCVAFSFVFTGTSRCMINGVNLYPFGRGK